MTIFLHELLADAMVTMIVVVGMIGGVVETREIDAAGTVIGMQAMMSGSVTGAMTMTAEAVATKITEGVDTMMAAAVVMTSGPVEVLVEAARRIEDVMITRTAGT